jgi:TonB-dependent receptor
MNRSNSRLARAVKRALIPTLELTPCTAACAGALLALGSGAAVAQQAPAAQDQPSEPLEEIVVTGIRHSIQTAISLKEMSNDIVETISAEDLGKLPDLSIADSLARLPGLAAQRTDGRSNFISIRGFAADFSGTTLMGREQASTGENRGVEFDQYPAELMNAVEVYKTPDASLIGQGLAGTVNLETVKPLSSSEMKMAFNVRGEHSSFDNLNPGSGVGSTGSRLSFSVLDQFLDHKLGMAFGVARLDSPLQEKQYQAWWWGVNNGPPGSGAFQDCCGSAPVPGDPSLAISEEGMQVRAKSQSNVRTGLMGVLEWAPSDSYHGELDLFFSQFNERTYLNGLQWSSSPWDGISYSNAQTTTTGGYTVLTGGTLNGIKPIMQNEFTHADTRNFSAGWNNRWGTREGWTVATDLSYSTAHDVVHDAYAFTGPQQVVVNGIGFQIPWSGSYGAGSGYPTFNVPINLADPSLVGFTDPDGYGYNGRVENDNQTDTIRAIRLDLIHPLGWIFKSGDLGFDYSKREKVKSALVDFAFLNGNGCSTTNAPACMPPAAPYNNTMYTPIGVPLYAPTSLSYAGVPGVVNYNVLQALASQFYTVEDMGGNDFNRNYSVEEMVAVTYLKLDIDQGPMRGNVGVQVVHTNQSSSAVVTDPNTGQPNGTVRAGDSYYNVLPSLNLVFDLGNRSTLRFAAAREMMRGRIDDEKAASSASVTGNPSTAAWSGSGGNPHLRPYIADSVDLSWEKVFGKASYFSAALFHKELTSYIFTQTVLYDFTGYKSFNLQPANNNPFGFFSTPENGSGGKIQGYELALALEGGQLSSLLDGFGMQTNFAYTNNYVPPAVINNIPAGPTTFPGFSKKVGALTLYYEKYGFSLRAAWTYRSAFTGETVQNFDQLGYTQIAPEWTTNLQAGYEIRSGKAQGLSFLLQVNNMTNSPYRTVQINGLAGGVQAKDPLEYDTFGRTYLFGINYKIN